MLRLLFITSVLGAGVLTVRQAWHVYDRWIDDPRLTFYRDTRGVDSAFREATAPLVAAWRQMDLTPPQGLGYAAITPA